MAAARLRAVPERPRRMLGVVRVSRERDGMISPELQEHAIREHCADRGHDLVEPLIYGLDESGSRKRSAWWRKLEDAVAAVETGSVDGIVIWKFNRVARNRLRWNVAVDRVESAGGVLESATEDFDTTTSAGRFARGVTAEMNAFQAEMIGESWVEAHERRVRRGLPHSGRAHFGYEYDKLEKLHLPHPEQGPVLADAYRRYIAGESVYSLARWLNSHGWRTVAGGPWSDRTLRRVLDDGFASGRFAYRKELHDGKHRPLISDELWQAYLDARGARRAVPARTERSTYLLSGLVRCARCGGAMVANYVDPGTKPSHRAKGRAEGKRYSAGKPRMTFRCQRGKEIGACPGGSINMRFVEDHVYAYVVELAAQVDEHTEDKVVVDARRTLLEVEEQRLSREAAKVEQALIQLAVRDAENPMPRATYAAAKTQLEARAAELTSAIESTGRTYRRAPADPAAVAAQLLEEWEELPAAGRREILRGLIDCVLVRTGDREMRVVGWEEVRP